MMDNIGNFARSSSYQGSRFNVRVLWENDEISAEPLKTFAEDAEVECAIYAKENGLLDVPGWKRFQRIAKREKLLNRLVQQAKLRSY